MIFRARHCRLLTSNEVAMARSVFGTALNTDSVKLCEHPLVLKGYAISPNGNIYFHKNELREDFSVEPLHLRSWLIHELTHVWQIQQGIKVVKKALLDRRYRYALNASKDFLRYGIEQQAQMVQDFYERRERQEDCTALAQCIPFVVDTSILDTKTAE